MKHKCSIIANVIVMAPYCDRVASLGAKLPMPCDGFVGSVIFDAPLGISVVCEFRGCSKGLLGETGIRGQMCQGLECILCCVT